MIKKSKLAKVVLAALLTIGMSACASTEDELPDLSSMGKIGTVSREEGSGTRSQFESLLNLSEVSSKSIAYSTEDVLSKVQEDKNAIGYVAYSSTKDIDAKVLQIDGVSPSEKTIKKNNYPLCRNYYLAYNGELSDVETDFLNYVMSQGQDIVNEYCVPCQDTSSFLSDQSAGTIRIEGSTSMEAMVKALVESYQQLNPNATIEVVANDSSEGLNAAIRGECDFAMSSRELKDYEQELLESKSIGKDAVAIVVNKDNPLDNLSVDLLTKIYNGDYKKWEDLSK